MGKLKPRLEKPQKLRGPEKKREEKATNGRKRKKLGAEPRIGRRKQRKKKLKKTERNQRELTFNGQDVMLLLPSPLS